ncbi:MAG: VanZ family protein [Peptostreptococcaceae bacterium]|nr:VanZ family protein [Peptostreptococcaceae bacterium]
MFLSKKINRILKMVFYLYIILIIIFVAVKFNGSLHEISMRMERINESRSKGVLNLNLTPLRQISTYLKRIDSSFAIRNLMSNILLFFPLGVFLPVLYDKNFLKTLVYSLIFSLLIEILQFMTMLGYADIDDVILNIMGSLAGYITFKLLHKTYMNNIPKKVFVSSSEESMKK